MDKTNTMGIKSMSVKERIALAHDTSDEEVLCTLAKDESPSVCTAANKALKERRMKSQQKQER